MSHSTDAIALWRRAQEIDEFPGNEGTNTGTSVRAGFKVLRDENLITSDYRWAANADEALRLFEANADIGLLFTDVSMPGSMSGSELACEVAKRWPGTGIIMTSGRPRPLAILRRASEGSERPCRCWPSAPAYRVFEMN